MNPRRPRSPIFVLLPLAKPKVLKAGFSDPTTTDLLNISVHRGQTIRFRLFVRASYDSFRKGYRTDTMALEGRPMLPL